MQRNYLLGTQPDRFGVANTKEVETDYLVLKDAFVVDVARVRMGLTSRRGRSCDRFRPPFWPMLLFVVVVFHLRSSETRAETDELWESSEKSCCRVYQHS